MNACMVCETPTERVFVCDDCELEMRAYGIPEYAIPLQAMRIQNERKAQEHILRELLKIAVSEN